MSASSVDEIKTRSSKPSPANASSCCGGDAKAQAAVHPHAHGSCASEDHAATHSTTTTGAGGQSHSSAGHHRKTSGCCGS